MTRRVAVFDSETTGIDVDPNWPLIPRPTEEGEFG